MLALALIAAGCGDDEAGGAEAPSGSAPAGDAGNGGDSGGSDDVIEIGAILTLTGQVASYGEDAKNAIDLAVSEWNDNGGLLGRQIKVTYEDTAGDPAQTPTVTQRVISADVDAVIGPLLSFECLIAQPLLEEASIPSTSGQCSVDELYTQGWEYFFGTFPTEERGFTYGAGQIAELGFERVAFIDDGEAYGQAIIAGVRANLEANDLESVGDVTVQLDQTDFSSQITALRGMDADVIVCGCFPFLAATIAKQADALGLDTPFALPTGSRIDADVANIGGTALVGSYHFGSTIPQDLTSDVAVSFVENYDAAHGEGTAGRSWNAFWYDAANALFSAIEAAGSTEPDAVAAAFRELEIDGATGVVTFCDTGERTVIEYATHEVVEGSGPGGIDWQQVGEATRDVVAGCS